MVSRTVLTSDDIDRAVNRISHEIIESNHGVENLLILGIPTRGVFLAQKIAKAIERNYPGFESKSSLGTLDVTLFRDDLASKAGKEIVPTFIPVTDLDSRTVVLVDDVLFSGRTIRAALDAIVTHGRPKAVRLAVLVDRGHRELPIRADFVGKNIPTSLMERVSVKLLGTDDEQSVVIQQ